MDTGEDGAAARRGRGAARGRNAAAHPEPGPLHEDAASASRSPAAAERPRGFGKRGQELGSEGCPEASLEAALVTRLSREVHVLGTPILGEPHPGWLLGGPFPPP